MKEIYKIAALRDINEEEMKKFDEYIEKTKKKEANQLTEEDDVILAITDGMPLINKWINIIRARIKYL